MLVDGTDLTALDEDARTRFRRRHIGFVFQFFNLIPLLTVEENLLLPLELNGGAPTRRAWRGRARCSIASGSAGAGRACRSGCPEASSSGWPSRGRWSTTPR